MVAIVGGCLSWKWWKGKPKSPNREDAPDSDDNTPGSRRAGPIFNIPPDASSPGTVLRGSPVDLEVRARFMQEACWPQLLCCSGGEACSQPPIPLYDTVPDGEQRAASKQDGEQGFNDSFESGDEDPQPEASGTTRQTVEPVYGNVPSSTTPKVAPAKPPRTGAARPVSEPLYTEPDLHTGTVIPKDRHDLIPAEYEIPVNQPSSPSESTSAVTSATVEAYSIVSLVPQASVTPPEPPVMHTEISPGEDSLDPTSHDKAEETGEEVTEQYARPDPRHIRRKQAQLEREEQLRLAAAAGNNPVIQQWLSDPTGTVSINAPADNGNTALHLAAQNNQVEVIHSLLSFDVNLEAVNKSGTTPLLVAAQYGQLEAFVTLFNAGANAAATNYYGEGIVQLAAQHPTLLAFLTNTKDGHSDESQQESPVIPVAEPTGENPSDLQDALTTPAVLTEELGPPSMPEVSGAANLLPNDPEYAEPIDALKGIRPKSRQRPSKIQRPVQQPAEGEYAEVADRLIHQQAQQELDTLHGVSLVPVPEPPVYANANTGTETTAESVLSAPTDQSASQSNPAPASTLQLSALVSAAPGSAFLTEWEEQEQRLHALALIGDRQAIQEAEALLERMGKEKRKHILVSENHHGMTALHSAIQRGRQGMVWLLLNYGAGKLKDSQGRDVWFYVKETPDMRDMVETFFQKQDQGASRCVLQ